MMPRYDLDLVKSAADGRWKDILAAVGGVDPNILDGSHHACPKQCHPDAGGKDRFRALDDFDTTGGVFCNQCFSTKNRSGFDALQWLTGEDFKTVLGKVAKHLGIKAIKGRKKANPADHLEFLAWNKTLVGLWCLTKKPIAIDSIQRLGGKVAKYRKQYTVIAIPVWGPQLDTEDAVGWILYRADGGLLPKYTKKDEPPEWVKVKLTAGSGQGVITELDKWKDVATKRRWCKAEGTPDLAAALSQEWLSGDGWFTTANGASEKPLDWIVERLRGHEVYVVHDCDKPGQQGATWVEQSETGRRRAGWCPVLAEVCNEVRNIVLPFPIEPSHGPDLRDFLAGGARVEDWRELVSKSPVWKVEATPQAAENWIEKSEDDPSLIAEVNLRKYRDAGRNLVQWRGEWFQYKANRYESINKIDLRIRIRQSIQDEFERQWHEGKKDKPARKVSSMLVNEVTESTASMSYVDREVEIGSWIEQSTNRNKWDVKEGPLNCVGLKNGILCLDKLFQGLPRSEFLIPHNSTWFSTICLPYDFDADAKCPTWIQFLDDVFAGDQEAIDTLQKWIGYLLVQDMSLEKIMFIIGKKRSGKGTIMKTIIELLGRSSVSSPSLNAFAGQYMLHSLVGKSAVVIPDVRLSRRSDNVVITERLLSISGCDPQDIERKYLDTLNGVQMQCRFTLFSNMLPYLEDHSAAFVSRCIFLSMPNTYYGREDLTLFERIKREMSGILNWAVMGQYRLRELKEANQQVLVQPESGLHLQRQMQTMAAPVSQFLLDRVEITDNQDHSISVHELFELWCEWCSENDRVRKLDQETFRRSIRDVHPNAVIKSVNYAGKRESRLFGMMLKEEVLL